MDSYSDMKQMSLTEMQIKYKQLRRQKVILISSKLYQESVKKQLNLWQEEFRQKEGRTPLPKDKENMGPHFQKYANLKFQVEKLEKDISEKQGLCSEKLQSVACQTDQIEQDKYKQQINEITQQLKQVTFNFKQASQNLKDKTLKNQKLLEVKDVHEQKINNLQHLVKQLTNQIEDIKGKVRVYCRIRPLLNFEKEKGCQNIIEIIDEMSFQIGMKNQKKTFKFDSIFDEKSNQETVYNDIQSMIQQCYDGYNVCIFTYGQTGSGKTYTMYGNQERPGIIPRVSEELFNLIKVGENECSIVGYVIEIYKDQIIDLLSTHQKNVHLDIKEDAKGITYIQNITNISLTNKYDLIKAIDFAFSRRKTSTTDMNEVSSRSHFIISLCLESINRQTKKKTISKLSLIDLAGSERINKSNATPNQINEAKSINKSLSALGDVITILSENNNSQQNFVPYRNSKLTYLMKDSLGGNSKTLMIINISPADYNLDETLQALNYGQRVKNITNETIKNAETLEYNKLKEYCRVQLNFNKLYDYNRNYKMKMII